MKTVCVMFTSRSRFWMKNTLFGQTWSKKQNCQFKPKFGPKTNSNMQNSIVLFTFSVLSRKHPFWAYLVQKIKIDSLNWKLVPRLSQSHVQNSMALFSFSVLDGKHLLRNLLDWTFYVTWVNLLPMKHKINKFRLNC